MPGSQRITSESAVTTLADADVLYKDNPSTGSGKIAFSDLKAQVEIVARKGVASGYAPTDSDNLIPALHLRPSFTIEEVADAAARDALTVLAAEVGKRLVRLTDTGVIYLANATGSGSSKWTTFNSVAAATTGAAGISRRATAAEARSRTHDSAHITPETMAAGVAILRNALAAMQGLVFDGTAGASGTLASAIGTSAVTFTVDCDVPSSNPSALRTIYYVASGNSWQANDAVLYINTDGTLNFQLRGTLVGDTRIATVTSNLVSAHGGKRVRIAVTRSSTTLTMFIDGVSQAFTVSGSAIAWDNTIDGTALRVGDLSANGLPFVGYIGGVRIYNRALSAAEVLALYESGAPAAADYPVPAAGQTVNTDAITNGESGSYTASSATGLSATGATVVTTASGFQAVFAAPAATMRSGNRVRVTFTATINSGAGNIQSSLLNASGHGCTVEANYTVVAGANTAEFTVLQPAGDNPVTKLWIGASNQATDFVISGLSVKMLGLLCAPEQNAPGNGLVWNDQSGNGAHIVLPTSGVAWALPNNAVNRVRGTTNTNGNQQLHGATTLLADTQITRIRARSRTGTPTITLGTASGGSQLVASVALSTTWKDLTIALTGGIVTTNSSVWVGSNSTDVVEVDISHEPLND
jgi:hypothetical protein